MELNIRNYVEVTDQFNENYFKAQFYFIKKLNFDDSMLYSIEKYNQRQKENHIYYDELNEESNSNQQINMKTEVKSEVFNNPVKKTGFKTSNIKSARENQEEDINRKRATEIIKKLFIKKFNPRGNLSDMSKNTQKWVNIINKYISNKNKVVDKFISLHIEDLDNDFDEECFFGLKLMKIKMKKEFIEISNFERERETEKFINNNSSFVSNSSKSSDINNNITKNKIKNNHKNKQNNLNIIFYFFLIGMVFWIFMMYFAYLVNYINNKEKINLNLTGHRLTIFNKFSSLINIQVRIKNKILEDLVNKYDYTANNLIDKDESVQVEEESVSVETALLGIDAGEDNVLEPYKYDELTNWLIDRTKENFNIFFHSNNSQSNEFNSHIYNQLFSEYKYKNNNVESEISTLNFLLAICQGLNKGSLYNFHNIHKSDLEINKKTIITFLIDLKQKIEERYLKDYRAFLKNKVPLIIWWVNQFQSLPSFDVAYVNYEFGAYKEIRKVPHPLRKHQILQHPELSSILEKNTSVLEETGRFLCRQSNEDQ